MDNVYRNMPHQCVRCGQQFPDGSGTLLKGCSCGSRFFFYFKEKPPEQLNELRIDERKEIENDMKEIIGNVPDNEPVILDFESIRISKPGKFEIDLVSLFKRKPVIYKTGEGKYFIDLASTFQMMKKK